MYTSYKLPFYNTYLLWHIYIPAYYIKQIYGLLIVQI